MLGSEWHSNPTMVNGAGAGAGYVTNVGGLTSYVTGSPFSMFAICMISDVFGINATLFRNVADKVAAKGYRVVCPDLLKGDPFDSENENRPLPVWLKDHPPEEGSKAVKPVIEALKRDGASAIGIAGFCWGGKKTVTDLSKSNFVQASELLHPAYVTKDDIQGVETPITILGGQNDTITPPKVIKQFEQVLNAKRPKVDNCVKIFPKVSHGWTVRYDPKDPEAVKAADKAHQIMIDWFDKHLSDKSFYVVFDCIIVSPYRGWKVYLFQSCIYVKINCHDQS